MSPSKPVSIVPIRVRAYLGLGSNLGDSASILRGALADLRIRASAEVVAASSLYETAPVGIPGARDFLNAAVGLETPLSPEDLLQACLAIENAYGRSRTPGAGWASRTLDLDLLAYDEVELDGPVLTLPHPRLTERGFVLAPLAEIAPDLRIRGRTVADWARAADLAGVRRLAEGLLSRGSPKAR